MTESTVARLRLVAGSQHCRETVAEIIECSDLDTPLPHPSDLLSGAMWDVLLALDNLTALLDVVEAVAARDPTDGAGASDPGWPRCHHCGELAYNDPDGVSGWDHADDCPWLAARELCGMEDA